MQPGTPCQRCRQPIGAGCTCTIPLLPPTVGCVGKYRYTSRLAAESGLARTRAQWRRNPTRAPQPPEHIYRCPGCDAWHLTHNVG